MYEHFLVQRRKAANHSAASWSKGSLQPITGRPENLSGHDSVGRDGLPWGGHGGPVPMCSRPQGHRPAVMEQATTCPEAPATGSSRLCWEMRRGKKGLTRRGSGR